MPGPNLPDLDVARQTQINEPEALPPIASAQVCEECAAAPCPECPPPNQKPIARPGGPYYGSVGQSIQFNGLASSDPDPPYQPLLSEKDQEHTSWTFDADRGFPSVGFRLGFPTIQGPFTNLQAGAKAFLLLQTSGARVELRRVGLTNVYEAADSSYFQLVDGDVSGLLLRTTDGSQLTFLFIGGEYRCTGIKDRNGNYNTVKYDPLNGTANPGRITSVVGTLGRTINFTYDPNFRLQKIQQVLSDQSSKVWASFGYSDIEVQPNFMAVVENGEEALANYEVGEPGANFGPSTKHRFSAYPNRTCRRLGLQIRLQLLGPSQKGHALRC